MRPNLLGLSLSPSSLIEGFVKDVLAKVLDAVAAGASDLVAALLGFVQSSSDPIFSGGWWSSSGEAVFTKVLGIAGVLMALAFSLSVLTAMLSADHALLMKAVLRLPIAVLQMAGLTAVTAALISATDEASTFVAGGASHGLAAFAGSAMVLCVVGSGAVGFILAGLLILAGLAVWAQLLVRAALLYCAVMAGPLVFAASVHPSASGLKKRYLELGISLIVSKLVVALAFATGAAMLGGTPSAPTFAQATGALIEALAILLIAAFAPFILIRLLIGAEAILVAEGLERRPVRSAIHGAQVAYYGAGLARAFGHMGSDGGGFRSSGRGGGGPRSGGDGASPSGGGQPNGPRGPAGGQPDSGATTQHSRPPQTSSRATGTASRPGRAQEAGVDASSPQASDVTATTQSLWPTPEGAATASRTGTAQGSMGKAGPAPARSDDATGRSRHNESPAASNPTRAPGPQTISTPAETEEGAAFTGPHLHRPLPAGVAEGLRAARAAFPRPPTTKEESNDHDE
jgi:hypothetical protein